MADASSFQDAAQGSAAESSWSQWLWAASQSQGVLESLVATVVVVALLIVWWRLSRLGERIRSRTFLNDYFLGIEQALQGDGEGAEARLERVLAADPENHYARMLLGNVQLLLGRPEKAHAQHLLLRDSFEVGGARNALCLGMALLAAGRPREAADAALAASDRDGPTREALEFAFRARLQSGDPVGAAELGGKLLPQGRGGAAGDDEALRDAIAAAFAEAGAARLASGDRAAALLLLKKAAGSGRRNSQVALLEARLHAADAPPGAAAQRLLGFVPAVAAGDVRAARATSATVAANRAAEWTQRVAPLWPEGRWRCGACRAPLAAEAGRCPRCGAEGRAKADEPLLFQPVAAPDRLADALEANATHLRRVCRQALEADAGSVEAEAARRAVLELGARVVPELLPRASGRGDVAERAIGLLRDLGPGCAGALFAAAEELEDRRLLPDGGANANAVGRVVQSYGRQALPQIRALFSSARASSRKALIDYLLGLADMDEFQAALERFSPVEILNRVAKADEDVLQRFLQAVPKGSFVADALLVDPMFERDVDVLRAIPGARDPAALEGLLVRRGPSRALLAALLDGLDDETLQEPALRLLAAAGMQALDALVAALVDHDRSVESRRRIAGLVVKLGAASVERLCANFGSEAADSDDALRQTIVRMGDAAVDAVAEAYARPGWIERVTIGFAGKGGHRRRQLCRALRELGTVKARAALAALRANEQDQDLQLALDEALHHLGAKGRGGAREG